MTYEVRRHGEMYKIYENTTQQYIFKSNKRITCESHCEKLNNGSGFEGETPKFFSILTKTVDSTEFA
jgi:hypothetical protein